MRLIARWLLLTVLLTFDFPACAWGPTGHRAVGRFTEKYLTAKAARAVKDLLGPNSLAEAGTWADEIRSDSAWKHAYTWHFVSIEDDETYETSKKEPAGDILVKLDHFESALRNAKASRDERVIALKFFVHLVADIHQPLHVGRRDDRGGNNIAVNWHGRPENLHRVWDSLMIDGERLSFTELAEFLDPPSAQQIAAWQKTGYLDWASESRELRAGVYDIGDGQLGYDYSYKNFPVVEERLRQAAVRLAGKLNSIFK